MSNKQFTIDSLRTESHNYYPQDPRVLHASMGLVTEAAELQDALKKASFYGKQLDITNIKEEAGDMLWYLALLFDAIGTDFETEQARVIAKLKARFPDKFTNEKAENRDLVTERAILEGVIPSSKGREPHCPENLCDFCIHDVHTCKGNPTFGDGKGNDNVIACTEHKEPF
tara:strand:- start:295 stop:807 length:513 start_codon:yes stop_codon:yes gene_type:complete